MASNTPTLLSKKSQEAFLEFVNSAYNTQNSQWDMRSRFLEVDKAYMREVDATTEQSQARNSNKLGDKTKFQNITVPVVLPQVESFVVYQSSVFLTGTPIFGVVSNPQFIDQALQMETIIEEQSIRGGWVAEIQKFFRDGAKYNISALEVVWDDEVTAALETDITFSTSQGKPKEVIWSGNCVKRLDPYNLIWDQRVHPFMVSRYGEFAGYTEIFSRIRLKQYIATLPDKMVSNIKAAFESGLGSGGIQSYYTPNINPDALPNYNRAGSFNWAAWARLSGSEQKIDYKDSYEVTTLYCRILPSEFNLSVPAPNTPQVWKLIVVNNSVIIYAERQTNAHGLIPILFGQPYDDGLGYQTKSLAENALGFQDITSALWNSAIASRRRAISDRGLYDPSRVSTEAINSPNPAAKIPVRPAAYGKPLNEAYYPIPFRDDQAGVVFQETDQILKMANMVSGQNQARQGQFVKGNKTREEFNTVMGNANGRDQSISMLYEAQVFTPLKEILKLNILQYQPGTSLYNRESQQVIDIDPVALRKSVVEFKVSDGLTPSDKLVNADTLQVAMQVIGSSPQIAQRYNLGALFSYFMKTQGARISEFEKSNEQVAYEQALQAWQQTVMELGKSGVPQQSFPPQPMPEQYGYQPAQQGAPAPTGQPEVRNSVNNITNNITNQEV